VLDGDEVGVGEGVGDGVLDGDEVGVGVDTTLLDNIK
jgi:hypothetical protein